MSANIDLRWYNQVQVMGYFVGFVPYKYQKKSKFPISTPEAQNSAKKYSKNISIKLEILYRFPKTNIAQH